jgi:dihydropteroate synthase
MSQIYLSLGANLGDRATSLRQALAGLERDVTVTAVSPLYETEPWGVINQPPFLNLCVGGQTSLPPGELLHFCQTVEQEVGRTPTYRWGPRLIDIDLLFYNDIWGERTYIMGILNVTPDSFSGDGILSEEDGIAKAVAQAQQFAADGVDIIDIGGESTRPGSQPVDAAAELARVLPVIKAVRQAVDVVISVDSYRAAVAEAALAAGANWLNDVWGLRMDPDMAKLAAQTGCPIVLMHNRSKPKDVAQEARLGGRFVGVAYDNLIADVKHELQESIDIALRAGVRETQIILDPGIGFGKTVEQNLQLLDQLDQFKTMGFPILIGPSRKSFIGYTLDLPPDQRVEGTAAAVAIGIARGADIVRVHDVQAMARVARMTDKIVRR